MKQWHVKVRHFGTGETKIVSMPGGLHEAEALRGAAMKSGNYWRALSADLQTLPPETPNDREALRLQIEHATQMEALASWRERGVL